MPGGSATRTGCNDPSLRISARSGVALVPILLIQLAVPSDVPGYVFGIVRCRQAVYLPALVRLGSWAYSPGMATPNGEHGANQQASP